MVKPGHARLTGVASGLILIFAEQEQDIAGDTVVIGFTVLDTTWNWLHMVRMGDAGVQPLAFRRPPGAPPLRPNGMPWVQPSLIVEVTYSESWNHVVRKAYRFWFGEDPNAPGTFLSEVRYVVIFVVALYNHDRVWWEDDHGNNIARPGANNQHRKYPVLDVFVLRNPRFFGGPYSLANLPVRIRRNLQDNHGTRDRAVHRYRLRRAQQTQGYEHAQGQSIVFTPQQLRVDVNAGVPLLAQIPGVNMLPWVQGPPRFEPLVFEMRRMYRALMEVVVEQEQL